MTQSVTRVSIAVPVPVGDAFEYRWDDAAPPPMAGMRVRVPFGHRERIGIVVDARGPGLIGDADLKPIIEVIDPEPMLGPELLESLAWAAQYYHHPLGAVLTHALPSILRRGKSALRPPEPAWRLARSPTAAELASLAARAPRQAQAIAMLDGRAAVTAAELKQAGVSPDSLRRMRDKGWIAPAVAERPAETPKATVGPSSDAPELTPDQRAAVDSIMSRSGFSVALLYGVTGSGKTEVFLRLIGDALARDRQCLLLVPEIGLTPQLVERLRTRFGCHLAVFHSGLTDTERLEAWRDTRSGRARLIVGTRSAAFAPLIKPGLIVIDEEHDLSYKQQSGFRYSARDLAIVRARALGVPIVLASATPSLESLQNASSGRYQLLRLPERIGPSGLPTMRIVDLNRHAARQGLSTPLLTAMRHHLARKNQVLLFINRRGFAPALFCPNCEISSECSRCDARLTIHARRGELCCHHCGRREPLKWACPDCGSERIAVGAGTERILQELESLFPDQAIVRIDRDVVSGRDALHRALADIESGQADIIVGTQLLTKGHDFPGVTLVGVLNADQGLFGTDVRSEERLAQTIVQVAGRAGRREQSGEVLIQTHHPNHPLLKTLLGGDYSEFAEHALVERRATGWPPFSYLAVFRAEARERERVFAFLDRLKAYCPDGGSELSVLGPAADRMERREGRYRAQLALRSVRRNRLHHAIDTCLAALAEWPEARRVRWSIDVDPAEL